MSSTVLTSPRWSWSPLTVRLMLAQTAVLLIGLIIVVVTAVLVGPNMFYHELVESGHADEALGLVHLEDAFRSVSLTALAIGGLPALYIAGLLTFYLYRTIGRSLASFSTAAGEVAAGNYDVRVTSTAGPGVRRPGLLFQRDGGQAQRGGHHTAPDARRPSPRDAHPTGQPQRPPEGVEDGVVALDAHTTGILHAQITRLERLARDIRQLTAAEEGMTRLQLTPKTRSIWRSRRSRPSSPTPPARA